MTARPDLAEIERLLEMEERFGAPSGILPAYRGHLRSLLARIRELEAALTPSRETKAAYIGEFKFAIKVADPDGGDEHFEMLTVPWTTIKEIMAAILAHAALENTP